MDVFADDQFFDLLSIDNRAEGSTRSIGKVPSSVRYSQENRLRSQIGRCKFELHFGQIFQKMFSLCCFKRHFHITNSKESYVCLDFSCKCNNQTSNILSVS